MHERSLVQDLLRQVERLMREHGARRLLKVSVSAGEFSGVEPELLRLAFEELAPESAARGAVLELAEVPLEARCGECDHLFRVRRFRFQCPQCRGRQVTVVRGEGLVLESVTLEYDEP